MDDGGLALRKEEAQHRAAATPETIMRGCQFASDNTSAICPEAWEALERANVGYSRAYGEDAWTRRAVELLCDLFETDLRVYFTYNGTAANSLALSSICQSYHSVICSDVSHIETDECGGPEFFSNGIKLLLAPSESGKLLPDGVTEIVQRRTDIHYPKPRVLSLTQATELGTTYRPEELESLATTARRHSLRVHLDGARFANAVAELGVRPKEVSWKIGVEVLCLGGSKSGLPVGDAVLFFRKELAEEFDYRCKQAGQLASKMRFVTAPWVGLLESGAWLRHAEHANRMADRLEKGLRQMPGIDLLFPRQANAVFVRLPEAVSSQLSALGWSFYTFIGKGGARFMCSWSTTEMDVDLLLADVLSITKTLAVA